MGLADWAIVLVVLVSAFLSARQGFVKEALSLGAWVGGIVVVYLFWQPMAGLLEPYIETSEVRVGLASFMLFVMVLAVGGMVRQLLGDFVRLTGLESTDRFLGVCFGLARGILVVLVLLFALAEFTPLDEEDWWSDSRLIEELASVVNWARAQVASLAPSNG